jgi:hypothetical protein
LTLPHQVFQGSVRSPGFSVFALHGPSVFLWSHTGKGVVRAHGVVILPPSINDSRCLGLLKNPNDLFLGESTLPHDDGLLGRRHELIAGIPGGGKVNGKRARGIRARCRTRRLSSTEHLHDEGSVR